MVRVSLVPCAARSAHNAPDLLDYRRVHAGDATSCALRSVSARTNIEEKRARTWTLRVTKSEMRKSLVMRAGAMRRWCSAERKRARRPRSM